MAASLNPITGTTTDVPFSRSLRRSPFFTLSPAAGGNREPSDGRPCGPVAGRGHGLSSDGAAHLSLPTPLKGRRGARLGARAAAGPLVITEREKVHILLVDDQPAKAPQL